MSAGEGEAGVRLDQSERPSLTQPRPRRLIKARARHLQRPCRAHNGAFDPLLLLNDGHSITSSAKTRIEVGKVMPSAFAAFMLIVSANFVARWTDKSAG